MTAATRRRSSHIWRSVDIGQASNRLALLAFVLVTAAATVIVAERTDAGLGGALVAGLRYGVGAFLAWAVGRELDPDRTASARAAIVVYLVVAWTGTPDLAAVAALLLALRVVVRSTGLAPTVVDLGLLVALAAVAATSPAGFVTAVALAWALHVDRRLPMPADDRPSEVAAALAGAAAVTVTIFSGAFVSDWELPGWFSGLVIVAAIAAGLSLRTATVSSVGDLSRAPLHIDRLVHARRLALVALAAAVLWSGASAVAALSAALAAVIGAGLVAAGVGERLGRHLPSR